MTLIEENLKLKVENISILLFIYFFFDISSIFLIIFYFIEKSKSKSEEEEIILKQNFEEHNQFSIETVFLFISSLIFKSIFNYNITIIDNKIKEMDIFVILIFCFMLLEIFIFKKII